MCGLVGFTTNYLTVPEIKRIQLASTISALRGEQSTGTIVVDKEKTWRTHKRVAHPFEVTKSQSWNDIVGTAANRLIMIHTRLATKGAVKLSNAHPFTTDSTVGMHNGTINYGIPDKYKEEVDSHGLYNFISAEGIVKALSSVKYGAYALQFLRWDEHGNMKAHIIRNEERTLYYVENGFSRLWMSDKDHLEFVASQTKFTGKVESFKPYHLYTIDVPATGSPTWSVEDFTSELKKPTYEYGNKSGRFFPSYYGWEDWDTDQTKPGETQSSDSSDVSGRAVIPFDSAKSVKEEEKADSKTPSKNAYVNAYGRMYLSRARYNQLKRYGCAWCGADEEEDYKESFIGTEDWLCHVCADNTSDPAAAGIYWRPALEQFQRQCVNPQNFKCTES